jgi:hypothetical protein
MLESRTVSGNKRTLRREVNWQKSVEMAFKDAPPSRIEHLVGKPIIILNVLKVIFVLLYMRFEIGKLRNMRNIRSPGSHISTRREEAQGAKNLNKQKQSRHHISEK